MDQHLDDLQDVGEVEDLQFAKKLIGKEITKMVFDLLDEIQTKAHHHYVPFQEDEYEDE